VYREVVGACARRDHPDGSVVRFHCEAFVGSSFGVSLAVWLCLVVAVWAVWVVRSGAGSSRGSPMPTIRGGERDTG